MSSPFPEGLGVVASLLPLRAQSSYPLVPIPVSQVHFTPKDWRMSPQTSPEAVEAEGSTFRLGLGSGIEVPGSASQPHSLLVV